VIGTYAAALAVGGAALPIGQAAIALCGMRRWSWLSPAVGLALLCAIGWATVRLPGGGATSAVLVLALAVVAAGYLRGRLEGGREALRTGLPVALPALVAASLPFLVEGHFGILGTGFNPDMSQHLLATARLADGADSQLLNQGYPLGPHAVVAALHNGMGIGLVQGFGGLTVAVAVLAPLTALAAFAGQPPLRRTAAALLVGLPYLVASYFAQGAFKETLQALLVLAFVLALRESSQNPAWRELPLRFVPAALIAVGSVYVYSFPGLVWLAGTAAIWAIAELAWARYAPAAGGTGEGGVEDAPARSAPPSPVTGPAARRSLVLALVVFAVGALPELGRMIDFQRFETFDPTGPGLGNLFGQLSPFEALGIWPSGDFRLAPGDGAAPALVYHLGAAFAVALLLYGLVSCWRRREAAIVAGLLAAAGVYGAARLGGTPYTTAKALEIVAPLVTLTILLPLNQRAVLSAPSAGGVVAGAPHGGGRRGRLGTWGRAATTGPVAAALVLYLFVAAGCALLAFANAPVGPTSYSPALTGLRPLVAGDSTLVLAPDRLLSEEEGARYIAWELRGGRVCIEPERPGGGAAPSGVRFVVSFDSSEHPPFRDLRLRRAGTYVLWERRGAVAGPSPCPLIAERQGQAPGD
jgi:hypothetical protein